MHLLSLKYFYKTDASFKACMSQEASYCFSMLDEDSKMVPHGELNYIPVVPFHSYYMLLKKQNSHFCVLG